MKEKEQDPGQTIHTPVHVGIGMYGGAEI